jgi:hypothetical protein
MILHGSVKQCKYITIEKMLFLFEEIQENKKHQHSRVGGLQFLW